MQTVISVPVSHVPVQLTPFVGREDELGNIQRRLTDPNCRLLTLVGPGGMGKTRLALQAATQQMNAFQDGVFWVDLQPLQSTQFLVTAVADTLGLPLAGLTDIESQLLRYLADRQLLLVLDNFEHLLEGADHLHRWLQVTSGLKVLVTSREALNLQQEWLFPVTGLIFPASLNQLSENCTAVTLFNERARQVRPSFDATKEAEGVVEICQLVDGMPLAIELAAAWARSLSSVEIAAEIQRNLDFLTTSMRNVPDRHRSVQAIFDQTWQHLTDREKDAFKRFSVFRGGFQRDAASFVAGATLPVLSSLVEKSLLRWLPESQGGGHGRYQIHELLRQYAAEKLAADLDDVFETRERHCHFYSGFLDNLVTDLNGNHQREAVLKVDAELDNIRSAWQWAIVQPDVPALDKATVPLQLYYQITSRYQEGARVFAEAVNMLQGLPSEKENELVLTKLQMVLGWKKVRIGQIEEGEHHFKEAVALQEKHQSPVGPFFASDPQIGLAIISMVRGDYKTAERLTQAALSLGEHINNQIAYYILAQVELAQGNVPKAHEFAKESYSVSIQTGQRWFRAYALMVLGDTYLALNDFAGARQQYELSFSLRQEMNDPEGMALASNRLGKLAWQQGNVAEAEKQFAHGLTIYREINDLGGLAESLTGFGETAVAQGNYKTACSHFNEALQITLENQFTFLLLNLLLAIADLCSKVSEGTLGEQILAFILNHPAVSHDQQAAAQHLADEWQRPLPAEPLSLTSIVTAVQASLTPVTLQNSEPDPAQARTAETLVEPLTNREIEVLQLMADGLTNPEIAETLIIAVGTVKSYTAQIYAKLGVRNRVEAVACARDLDLLS